uniref:MIP18 family-like domain-containing protein n=1 Tax=Trypanosoma congolense (strain IL3000) TaxID=1068625 RepID=G0UUC9_TRYCI|nr:conserved hypothetical protein [Trypanosoma congolense IL3000]
MITPFTAEDVFYELSTIRDPEHTNYTLADLNVVTLDRCFVEYREQPAPTAPPCMDDQNSCEARVRRTVVVKVVLKPTVPHCSLMEFICLCVYAKLKEVFPPKSCPKIEITLVDASHIRQRELEKQVADKDRIVAAFEDAILLREVEKHINCE